MILMISMNSWISCKLKSSTNFLYKQQANIIKQGKVNIIQFNLSKLLNKEMKMMNLVIVHMKNKKNFKTTFSRIVR